jgi:hypothetical protein
VPATTEMQAPRTLGKVRYLTQTVPGCTAYIPQGTYVQILGRACHLGLKALGCYLNGLSVAIGLPAEKLNPVASNIRRSTLLCNATSYRIGRRCIDSALNLGG